MVLCQSDISEGEKMNLNPNLRPHNKTIPDEFRSHMKGETIKLWEENTEEHLHDLEGKKKFK